MNRINKALWAKKKEKDGHFFWLPLSWHLEDARSVAGFLWEHWLCSGQRKLIEDSLNDKDKAKSLVQFLAAEHDIGKATPAFQRKEGYNHCTELDSDLLENLERSGFSGISSASLSSPRKSPHNIAGQFLLHDYGVNVDISTIIGGHHGKPVDDEMSFKNQKSYKNNFFQFEDKNNVIYQKWQKTQQDILNWGLESCGFESVTDLPKIKQPAQVVLSGLLIMTDWIVSNEYYFPLIALNDDGEYPKDRAQQGFLKWRKSDLWHAQDVVDFERLYQKRFGFKPRSIQALLAEAIENSQKPGVFIVEAPMGVGKTEAALIAAEQLAYKTGRSGLFFGLPTQATSNGIFPRIETWLQNLSKDYQDKIGLRLAHGKAHLNDDFINLSSGVAIDNIDEDETVIVNQWFSGRKKTALDDFVVGTVDQFLMVALKQKHLALRHLGFSKKVVIIDEVHAYDAYMSQYLLMAVKWMGAYNVPVVILSATLPAEKRIELLKSYLSGMGLRWKDEVSIEENQSLKTKAYPLITHNDGNDIHQIYRVEQANDKKVKVIKIKEEDLSKIINEYVLDGAVVGIIVNTVKRAQSLAMAFSERFGENKVELLHSGFIATERITKEKNLINLIGKNANRPEGKIIIGTQVIEQSLDIDFDVLISDLAPIDLLIQRIGRLHRHADTMRPTKCKEPKFYVMGTSDDLEFEEGSVFVYGGYLLARTQLFLPDYIVLPTDISPLVQRVYQFDSDKQYDDDICLSEVSLEKYQDYRNSHNQIINIQASKAKNYRIARPILKERRLTTNSLIGWLKNSVLNESEEKTYAQVRDTEETIEVIALKKIGNGYGLFGQKIDLSNRINESDIAKEIAKNTFILPKILTKSYNIDNTIKVLETYNRENLANWRDSFWLKGALGIIFDENDEFILNGIKIIYSEKYGVMAERVE